MNNVDVASFRNIQHPYFFIDILRVFAERASPQSNKVQLNTASFNENRLNNQAISHKLTHFEVL